MMNQFIPIIIKSTRNWSIPALYVILTLVTVKVLHSLYRYTRTMSSSSSTSTVTYAGILQRMRILSSKLYFDVPPSRVPLVYSPDYDISFLGLETVDIKG
ncbi:hypothetical protein Patl1_36462 [Pistacia atlantica]|nr:hypothetical protein Patl1_36462 [Pistacia atlantica]